jgi:hypothetical protein
MFTATRRLAVTGTFRHDLPSLSCIGFALGDMSYVCEVNQLMCIASRNAASFPSPTEYVH